MKLEAGKTYSGFSRFDDGGCIYIDGQLVYNQGTTSGHNNKPSFTPQPYVCTKSGWYKLQLGMWDWVGGRGLREGSIAIVQWSDRDPADIKDNTRTYWNEFWDADADGKALGTYLYTEIPAQCEFELTRLSETSYKIAAVYGGVQSSAKAVARDASGNRIETSAVTLDDGDQTEFTLSELATDTAYDLILEIDLNGTTLSQKIGSVFTGTVSITAGEDADEATGHVGTFTVALSGGAVALSDIEVLYAVSDESTAVEGQTYVALPGKVTIPSGANAVTIQVVPAVDKSIAENTTVRLDLVASTVCGVHSSAASATITIVDGEEWAFQFRERAGDCGRAPQCPRALRDAGTSPYPRGDGRNADCVGAGGRSRGACQCHPFHVFRERLLHHRYQPCRRWRAALHVPAIRGTSQCASEEIDTVYVPLGIWRPLRCAVKLSNNRESSCLIHGALSLTPSVILRYNLGDLRRKI